MIKALHTIICSDDPEATPGAGTILLYEPRHPEAWDLEID